MPNLQYNGTITQAVFSNAGVSGEQTIKLDFTNLPVIWQQQNVPSVLVSTTLSKILSNPIFNVTYAINIQITGSQYFDVGSAPTTNITILISGGKYDRSYTADGPSVATDTAHYHVNDNFAIASPPTGIYVYVWNNCIHTSPCYSYRANDYSLILTLGISVTANCSGTNLNTPFCSEFCLTNPGQCLNDYIGYCFTPNPATQTIPITTSDSCQKYVSNYIQRNGPLAEFDFGLNPYCRTKYKGFGDLFKSGNQLDINLCACHMPDEQYAAYEKEVAANFSGFDKLGIKDRCMLAQCASTQYGSVARGAVCPVPQCLNIVDFNNDGTFNNSNVTINQTAECANIQRRSPPGPPGPNPPLPPGPAPGPNPNRTLYIIIGIIILILIIAIILLIVFGGKGDQTE